MSDSEKRSYQDRVDDAVAPDLHDRTPAVDGPAVAAGTPPPLVYDPLAPEPGTEIDPVAVAVPKPAATDASSESTVGTGTSIALGCIAGSVLLIIIAILALFLVSVIAN
ncbi:MAG: hypothetical protein WBA46_10390 [Thermomicrobiales bacterium]